MASRMRDRVTAAEIVVPCEELTLTLPFFLKTLGFRLDAIFPADDPAVAVVSGYGLCLRLERGAAGHPGVLRLLSDDPATLVDGARELTAPNGTVIVIDHVDPPLEVPPLAPELVVNRIGGTPQWGTGRAGMGYRDLIASRLGGRFIASHIRIADGGPVPDNVHYHKVRLQLIYCYKGWVRVAYEDQGEVVMHAGDCVLQPPEIRHRVLEASDGMEVIEIACPAEHVTRLDHDMALPTGRSLPDRDFNGQHFVFHVAKQATWEPWRLEGFDARDIGIAAATDGLGGVRVARVAGAAEDTVCSHDAEFVFNFVLDGAMTLVVEGGARHALAAGDSFLVPAGMKHAFTGVSADLQLLEVALPARFATTRHEGAVLAA